MNTTTDKLASFDLLEVLGLDFPLKERDIYYQEFLQIFLFQFILNTITENTEDESTLVLQKELNAQKSPDEIFETLQDLHPDFMIRFTRFVEKQKGLFVLNFLEGVIKSLKRKKELVKGSTAFDKKIERYSLALLAAQAEDWAEVKNILNPEAELEPVPQS